MSPEDTFLTAIRESGHLLLIAAPGLTPWLLLPLARAVNHSAASSRWTSRAKVWANCMLLSLTVLGLIALIDPNPPDETRWLAVLLAMLIIGIAYLRLGGDGMARVIGICNRGLLTLAGALALACALTMLANVVMRHVFAMGFGWARETVIYCYAACFMLGAAGTLGNDGHVRVDIVRGRLARHWQARFEVFGSLFLLLPVMLLILHVYAPQLALAWGEGSGRLETSDEGDGLPLAFLFKSIIPVFATTMIAQGWAIAWNASAEIPATPPDR